MSISMTFLFQGLGIEATIEGGVGRKSDTEIRRQSLRNERWWGNDSLSNLAQRPPLLPKVRDHTDTTALSATNALLDGVCER